MTDWFAVPFASAGDKTAIPDAVDPSGYVSFSQGYGPFYQLAKTDPNSKNIERDKMNYLFNRITAAIHTLQLNGVPDWTPAVDNDGMAVNYPAGAQVRYTDGVIYQALVVTAALPTDLTKWVPLATGIVAIGGLTNANVVLTNAQAASPIIILSGALTGNINITFPISQSQWLVVNNTTGAFNITCKTAAGTGVLAPQGRSLVMYGDGTNIAALSNNVGISRVMGLIGSPNAGTPNTQYDFSVTGIAYRNPTTGEAFATNGFGVKTNNILTAGPVANGRDQAGAFANSSWIHFHAIYNPVTGAQDTISSLSATAPALPAGYTATSYLGAVYLSSGGILASGQFRGSWFTYTNPPVAVNGGTATSITGVPIPTLVPPNALQIELSSPNIAISGNASTGAYALTGFIVVSGSAVALQFGLQGQGAASAITGVAGISKRFPNIGQNFAYYMTVAAGVGPTMTITVPGYSVPNGGE